MNNMTETEKAYLAGMIDGEGCITISCNKDRYFAMFVVLTGTHKTHIEYCANMTGLGSVQSVKRSAPWGDVTRWVISSTEAQEFLEAILPYLFLKKEQAEVAIKFQREVSLDKYNKYLSKSVIKKRKAYLDHLQQLKRTGKVYEDETIEDIELDFGPGWKQCELLS